MAAPWTSWWQRNYFADVLPWLRALMATPVMHVTVVAIGVVTAAVGVGDLWMTLATRHGRRTAPSDAPDV